jgi:hypothetical protein
MRGAISRVGVPLVTAAAGIAGGVLLGRGAPQPERKVLGIRIPNPKVVRVPGPKLDLGGLAQQVGEAGRQFGKLAQEVRAVREKAEQVSRVIS